MYTNCKSICESVDRKRVNQVKKVLNFDIAAADNNDNIPVTEITFSPVEENIVRIIQTEKEAPTRKRLRKPDTWAKNKRKKLRESGQEYVDRTGKLHAAKTVKDSCAKSCHLKCHEISDGERQKIRDAFYALSDAKKNQYYKQYTNREVSKRKRTSAENSRRKFTFSYYFSVDRSLRQVCSAYFCQTLDISYKRIYYFHQHDSDIEGVAKSPKKGKSGHIQTTLEKIDEIRAHIDSFPRVEAHYTRSSSKRQYLEPTLSIRKMYSMYQISHSEPVKENIYRKVFNEQFNLAFHKPKKDVCDMCSEFKVLKTPTVEQQKRQEEHLKRKETGNAERKKDRTNTDEHSAVVVFDLENVFSLPKANISCFFYKSKLSVYNLTAHCSKNKTVYNCLWNECTSGRAGNDLASALMKILEQITTDLPQLKKIILWSDSCIPQNKNSHMSTAVINFLSTFNHNLETIEQKFSEPGHGNLQEVDATHSLIERHIRNLEIYSPLSLMRALNKLRSKSLTFKFMQMSPSDFLLYSEQATKFSFYKIPYTKVKHIMYNKTDSYIVQFKLGFNHEFQSVNINPTVQIEITSNIKIKEAENKVSIHKIVDIQSLYKYMPADDKTFYMALFKNCSNNIALKEQSSLLARMGHDDVRTGRQEKTRTLLSELPKTSECRQSGGDGGGGVSVTMRGGAQASTSGGGGGGVKVRGGRTNTSGRGGGVKVRGGRTGRGMKVRGGRANPSGHGGGGGGGARTLWDKNYGFSKV